MLRRLTAGRKKTMKTVADAFVFVGIMDILGSTGACECGNYSVPEYMLCIAIGAVLVFTGCVIRKE